MTMHPLPGDVIRNPVFRPVPLKGARAAGEGRLIVLASASARALAIYLRAAGNIASQTPTGSGSGRTGVDGSRTPGSARF